MDNFDLRKYLAENRLLKEIDTRITTDVDLWIPGASDSDDPDDDANYIQRSLENKGIPSKVTVSIDEFYVDLADSSHLDNAKAVLQDLGYEFYTKNNPVKEDYDDYYDDDEDDYDSGMSYSSQVSSDRSDYAREKVESGEWDEEQAAEYRMGA